MNDTTEGQLVENNLPLLFCLNYLSLLSLEFVVMIVCPTAGKCCLRPVFLSWKVFFVSANRIVKIGKPIFFSHADNSKLFVPNLVMLFSGQNDNKNYKINFKLILKLKTIYVYLAKREKNSNTLAIISI